MALTARSEPGEVLPELPVGDLLVVAEPLVALHPRVVVDVVLVAPAAERGSEDLVALELADRLEQVRRQRPEAARDELLVARRVEGLGVRLARREALLDPVEPRGEHRRSREVRVRRAVHGAVLDPPGSRDPEHLRAVVVAVGDPDGRPGRTARGRARL